MGNNLPKGPTGAGKSASAPPKAGSPVVSPINPATTVSPTRDVKAAAETAWTGDTVRSSFIEYFKGKGHTHWPSSSVVPINDPTLLFANAGTSHVYSAGSAGSRVVAVLVLPYAWDSVTHTTSPRLTTRSSPVCCVQE
jgi:hypothetical protein